MILTGVGTTHDTTGTINQPTLRGEIEYQSFEPTEERYLSIDDDDEQIDYGDYMIGKPKSPPLSMSIPQKKIKVSLRMKR